MNLRDVLARNSRKHRNCLGLSQAELAARADCTGNYISDIERGEYAATVDIIERIAAVFEIEAYDLLDPNQKD